MSGGGGGGGVSAKVLGQLAGACTAVPQESHSRAMPASAESVHTNAQTLSLLASVMPAATWPRAVWAAPRWAATLPRPTPGTFFAHRDAPTGTTCMPTRMACWCPPPQWSSRMPSSWHSCRRCTAAKSEAVPRARAGHRPPPAAGRRCRPWSRQALAMLSNVHATTLPSRP